MFMCIQIYTLNLANTKVITDTLIQPSVLRSKALIKRPDSR